MKNLPKNFCAMFMRSFWIILPFIVFLALPLADAQVTGVTVAVDGMSCPFCAFGVEKKLKKVNGVGSVAVDLKSGTATVSVKEGESIQIDRIPDAIKAAGFTPGKIKFVASGTIRIDKRDRLLLQVRGSKQMFLFVNLKDDIKERLEGLAETGALVEAAGTFHLHVDEKSTITPESIEEVSK